MYYIFFVLFCFVSLHGGSYLKVQYNGWLLPDIILLTQCYYHREARLNAMKRFGLCIFPPDWGMLRRSRCVQIFFKYDYCEVRIII